MGHWIRNMFERRTTARPEPTPEPAVPTPAERAKDLQTSLAEEYAAMVAAANEAFIAQLMRDGYVWPSDSSPGLEEHRERLRAARDGSRW